MISSILGYDDDSEMDDVTLAIINEVSAPSSSLNFNFAEFLANAIHFQLTTFEDFKLFCYQSYLMYIILFCQCDF